MDNNFFTSSLDTVLKFLSSCYRMLVFAVLAILLLWGPTHGYLTEPASLVHEFMTKAAPQVARGVVYCVTGLTVSLILCELCRRLDVAWHAEWVFAWLADLLEIGAGQANLALEELSATRTFRSSIELGGIL